MATDLDEYRPHVNIETHDGNQHVIPMALIHDVANGEYYPGILGDAVLRSIVTEWLQLKEQNA